jgi:hypothetical protein
VQPVQQGRPQPVEQQSAQVLPGLPLQAQPMQALTGPAQPHWGANR